MKTIVLQHVVRSALLAAMASGCLSSPQTAPEAIKRETSQPVHATVPADPDAAARRERLEAVSHWLYFLDFEPDEAIIQTMADSTYDMLVIEPIFTDRENDDYPAADALRRLHDANPPKLVVAYVDIGQAEDWRTYWQAGWGIGEPDWIVGGDPDGWEGNYPVAFWRPPWKDIWLGPSGILPRLLDAGFDGIYLDWVEAYSDPNVLRAAGRDGVEAREEMIRWVGELAAFGRGQRSDFIVIAQNAAELAERDDYLRVIDAISQEQTWFDGAANNDPPGDCRLPRTEADVESEAYEASLSPDCRRTYVEFPDSTLHTSSEEYLRYLTLARDKGEVIFTVDYALDPANVAWVIETSRGLGFKPFVGERSLSRWVEPIP